MYDIEIVMPICPTGKYARRLQDFKLRGLQNIGEFKVKLKLLVGTFCCDTTGWPAGIDVEVVSCRLDHPAAKVNDYYSKAVEQTDTAKWFMRVDDDSITDISRLMTELSALDFTDVHYLTTEMVEGDVSVERTLLKELGHNYLADRELPHETECSILSQVCFKRILSCSDSVTLLERRAKIAAGFTDICLCQAARLAKILPTTVPFLSKNCDVVGLIQGKRSHIHWLAHDVNSHMYEILCRYTDRDVAFEFIDKRFVFYHKINDEATWITMVFLRKNGTIHATPSASHNEFFWRYDPSTQKLDFLSRHGDPTNEFVVSENFTKVEGLFYKDNKVVSCLTLME